MAKSLLHMISNDIGQLACLYAKLHGLNRVYFGGFFIRGHPVTMHTITYSINFFSKVTAVWGAFSPGPVLPSHFARPVHTADMAACGPDGAQGVRMGAPWEHVFQEVGCPTA